MPPNTDPTPVKFATSSELREQANELSRQKEDFSSHKQILNVTFGFIAAALVVCVISFITFLIDAWKFHRTSYNEFSELIRKSNGTFEQVKVDQTAIKSRMELLDSRLQEKVKTIEDEIRRKKIK